MKQKRVSILLAVLIILLLAACSSVDNEAPLEPTAKPGTTTQTLFVGAEKVDCVGSAPQKCLLIKNNAEDEYSFFYGSIEGFEWESGFEYELLISVTEVENPPADGFSLRYTLVEIVNKRAVAVLPSISILDGNWSLDKLTVDGEVVMLPDGSSAFLMIEDGNVSGLAGCNNFNGAVTFDSSNISFGPLATTRMACPEEVMAFETALLGSFESTTMFSTNHNMLELSNADGSSVALFTKQDEVE